MCHPEAPQGREPSGATTREVQIDVPSGERIPALIARPSGRVAGGVLIVPDIFGRSTFYEAMAEEVAAWGYLTCLPEPFFREGSLPERSHQAAFNRRARFDETRALEDLAGCRRWLRERTEGRLGTIGFCMGGTLVLDMAAEDTDLVTVSFYGFPEGSTGSARPAPRPVDLVDRIEGPVLAQWGDADAAVDQGAIARFCEALSEVSSQFEHKVIPGLPHGYVAKGPEELGEVGAAAARRSWERAVAFLARRVGEHQ